MKSYYSKNKISTFASKLFDPLIGGFSTSLFGVPKVGLSLFVKYLIKNPSLLDTKYSEFIKSNTFLWLDLNENLMYPKELVTDELNYYLSDENQLPANCSWKDIEDSIRGLIGEKEPGLVFVIDNANLLTSQFTKFAYRLMTLNRSFFSQVLFLFLSIEEIPNNEVTEKTLGQMYPLMMNSIDYFPLFDKEDMTLVKQNIWKEEPQEQADSAVKLAAGIPGLFRILHREFIKNGALPMNFNEMMQLLEIKHLFMNIWSSLDDSTQDEILKKDTFINDFLLRTGLKTTEGVWFSNDFEAFIAEIRAKTSKITTSSTSIEKLLTHQELILFNLLTENRGDVVSRDEIAQSIWEDQWLDKYSDWAIAKLISQLRKKTSAFEDITIKTAQNQGFMRV